MPDPIALDLTATDVTGTSWEDLVNAMLGEGTGSTDPFPGSFSDCNCSCSTCTFSCDR